MGETQVVSSSLSPRIGCTVLDPMLARSLRAGGLAFLARRQGAQQAVLHSIPGVRGHLAIRVRYHGTGVHGQETNVNVVVARWIPYAAGSS